MKAVIIATPPPLNKEQTRDAFAVSEHNPLWVAIMQMIRQQMESEQADQPASCVQNNSLLLAASAGAVNALSNLLIALEQKRLDSN